MAFVFRQKVLFKHCDPVGIVFYPRYFEMINDCIETYFDAELNAPFETIHKDGAVPTVEISAKFLAPSRHGDRLEIKLSCINIGRTSLTLNLHATCEDQTRFTAVSTLVHVNKTGRPEPWPDALLCSIKDNNK